MTVYNAGEIYLEDLSGGTSDQIHIYAQTDNIADGAVTADKLSDFISTTLDAISDFSNVSIAASGNMSISESTMQTIGTSYTRMVYAALSGEKTVRVSKDAGHMFIVGFTQSNPFTTGTPCYGVTRDEIATEIESAVPDGMSYVFAVVWNANTDTESAEDMVASVRIEGLTGALDSVARDSAAAASDEIDARLGTFSPSDIASPKSSPNLYDGVSIGGYVDVYGEVYQPESNYWHTNPIDVRGLTGETITAYYAMGSSANIRFVCALDESMQAIPAKGASLNAQSYTVPEGVSYVILTLTISMADRAYIMITTGDSPVYLPHVEGWNIDGYAPVSGAISTPTPQTLRAQSLDSGASLSYMRANSVKRLGTYALYCKPGTMTPDDYIIMGKDSATGYAVGVSSTKWAWFVNNSTAGGSEHGLTIKDYILITVDKVPGTGAVLTIRTNGGSYTRTNTSWTDNHGKPYVLNQSGDAISDVKMVWTSEAVRNRIWFMGDSYVSIAATRWPYYIYEWGFGENIMINGYPGENSESGYMDFIACLDFGKPSVAVWCMGMNDSDSGAINESWLEYTQAFISACELYDIVPVLATIPCCPLADHSYKNAWVRSSGLRYVDFASAVNVAQDSTSWYDGMISSDNIHPDVQGAIALASQVVEDVPEIVTR